MCFYLRKGYFVFKNIKKPGAWTVTWDALLEEEDFCTIAAIAFQYAPDPYGVQPKSDGLGVLRAGITAEAVRRAISRFGMDYRTPYDMLFAIGVFNEYGDIDPELGAAVTSTIAAWSATPKPQRVSE
jgi:hypothetical protein